MIEGDDEDKYWFAAEERAKAAFEAVLSYGTKIQGDHHLVFHTRTPFRTRTLPPEGLIRSCRLRVCEAARLSGRQGWSVEAFRLCIYWEGSGIEPSWMERQIQHGGVISDSFALGVVDILFPRTLSTSRRTPP